MGKLGLLGIKILVDYGGAEINALSNAIVMEKINHGCALSGLIMSLNKLYCKIVHLWAKEQQKDVFENWLYRSRALRAWEWQ
jgi:alkylation response protein AidB-like acyl-CoA dehydrogenase